MRPLPRRDIVDAGLGSGYLASSFRIDVIPSALETWHAPVPQGPFTLVASPAVPLSVIQAHVWGGQFPYGGRVVCDIAGAPIALWGVNDVAFAIFA
ncbi:MAG TPA: hypothetical protein VF152_02075, partial [Acidimicrobiia bacterium]